MKSKKILEFILFIAVILSIGFFSGCGSNGEEDPNPQVGNNDDQNDDDDGDNNSGNINSLTMTTLTPESPNSLSNLQPLFIDFDYDIVQNDDVVIIAAPYFEGKVLSDFLTGGYPASMGTGSGSTFVTISDGDETKIDQISLVIRNESNTSTIESFLFDVDFTFTPGDDAMYVVRVNPTSPATLTSDDELAVTVTYTFTGVEDLLNLNADMYFEGEPVSVSYGIFNKTVNPDIYGPDLSGGTTLTLVSNADENFQVDQIRIYASDGGDLLFEDFYDVDITWTTD